MRIWFLWLAILPGPGGEDAARLAAELEQRAQEQCRLGAYQRAEYFQRRALETWEGIALHQPVDLTPVHVNLAEIYLLQGKLRAAEEQAEAATRIQKRSAPPAERARVGALFARLRFQQEQYKEAGDLQAGVVRELEESGDGPTTALAVALNDLALIRAVGGDLRSARILLERSLDTYRRVGQTAIGGFGEVTGNLALICARQGDDGTAEILYRTAIGTLEKALGPEHPHVGMLLAEYAKLLRHIGRKADARMEERRAKAILQKADFPGRHTIDASGRR
jgi:tetratricopeptide (TPR) repeat protein